MIELAKGQDIFESDAAWKVCPVNRVGVMGNGLAFAFKERVAGLFDHYAQACLEYAFEVHGLVFHESDFTTVCFPSKRHWKDDSRIEDIDMGLRDLARYAAHYKPNKVAMPLVGTGKGKLPRSAVLDLIYARLAASETLFVVCV